MTSLSKDGEALVDTGNVRMSTFECGRSELCAPCRQLDEVAREYVCKTAGVIVFEAPDYISYDIHRGDGGHTRDYLAQVAGGEGLVTPQMEAAVADSVTEIIEKEPLK
jgi:hypothetical protein